MCRGLVERKWIWTSKYLSLSPSVQTWAKQINFIYQFVKWGRYTYPGMNSGFMKFTLFRRAFFRQKNTKL